MSASGAADWIGPRAMTLAESVFQNIIMIIGDKWGSVPDEVKHNAKALIGEYYFWQLQSVTAAFDSTVDGERAKENAAIAAAGLDCLGEVLAPKVREAMVSIFVKTVASVVSMLVLA